jgi:hypothetical protein
LTPPLLVLAVAESVIRQGKPFSMQKSPFLIDPACTAVYYPCSAYDCFCYAIVDIINALFFYQKLRKASPIISYTNLQQ